MTRKRKFSVGDLVVLKKGVRVSRFPSIRPYGLEPAERKRVLDEIGLRTTVHQVVKRQATFKPDIVAGTVGVVKGFSNVFMLEYDVMTDINESVIPLKLRSDSIFVRSRGDYNVAFLNRPLRMHMHVLIEGQLIAFAPGAKLFESADVSMARYASVDLVLDATVRVADVGLEELREAIDARLRRVRSVTAATHVTSIKCTARDGTIERRDPVTLELIG